jgi:hypothetical protein
MFYRNNIMRVAAYCHRQQHEIMMQSNIQLTDHILYVKSRKPHIVYGQSIFTVRIRVPYTYNIIWTVNIASVL